MAYGAAGDLGPVPPPLPVAWRMAAAAREPEQAGRLARFRAEHPEAKIRDLAFGTVWQVVIPGENDSKTVMTRYTLRELLDKLEEVIETDPDG